MKISKATLSKLMSLKMALTGSSVSMPDTTNIAKFIPHFVTSPIGKRKDKTFRQSKSYKSRKTRSNNRKAMRG